MRPRAIVTLLIFLAAAYTAGAAPCRYNCSSVSNIYCKTKELVCAYPDGDELAMQRANMLLAKSTKKKCTRAMKLFICHLWFPTCEKQGAEVNVKPVRTINALVLAATLTRKAGMLAGVHERVRSSWQWMQEPGCC
jgi:hypothetical protein